MGARERLREYGALIDEARDLRMRARRAEADAESGREADRIRAASLSAMYDALADEIEDRRAEIEIEIERVGRADWSRILRLRYIDGLSIEAVARVTHYSQRTVARAIVAALAEMDRRGGG